MSNYSPMAILHRTTASQRTKGREAPEVDRAALRRIGGFAARHKTKLVLFILLSAVSAGVAVATPVLAGRVVNAITAGGPVNLIVGIAILMGVLALADAALTIVSRYLSARIGEGLIFDLRTAVFDHVQTLPVAFFNRTRTGALISRLNNDVMGLSLIHI